MMEEKRGCCFRCEWRAKYLETGHGPRAECQDVERNYGGCYMYRPVMPVVMAVNDFEKEITKEYGIERPMFGPGMISARMHFVRLPEEEMGLAAKKVEDGTVPYWKPKSKKEIRKIKSIKEYKIFLSQGQNLALVGQAMTLKSAIEVAKFLKKEGSVSIQYPDGYWYDWELRRKKK